MSASRCRGVADASREGCRGAVQPGLCGVEECVPGGGTRPCSQSANSSGGLPGRSRPLAPASSHCLSSCQAVPSPWPVPPLDVCTQLGLQPLLCSCGPLLHSAPAQCGSAAQPWAVRAVARQHSRRPAGRRPTRALLLGHGQRHQRVQGRGASGRPRSRQLGRLGPGGRELAAGSPRDVQGLPVIRRPAGCRLRMPHAARRGLGAVLHPAGAAG